MRLACHELVAESHLCEIFTELFLEGVEVDTQLANDQAGHHRSDADIAVQAYDRLHDGDQYFSVTIDRFVSLTQTDERDAAGEVRVPSPSRRFDT